MIPTWWQFVLLALAAFRITRLIGWDVVTRPLRVRMIRRAEKPGTNYIGGKAYRGTLDEFVHCPWCQGWWTTLAWWLAWLAWPHGVILISVPLAANAVVGLVAKNLDP